MSDDNDKESKTEEATQRRVQDALDKGNLPFSREVGLLASILASAAAIGGASVWAWKGTAASLSLMLDRAGDVRLATPEDALLVILSAAHILVVAVALPLGAVTVAAFVSAVSQNPIRFIGRRIKPEFDRISLTKGGKRLLGRQNLVEFAKTLAKLIVVSIAVASFLGRNQVGILSVVLMEPHGIPDHLKHEVTAMLTFVASIMGILVVADVFWARYKWRSDLRMSKQEVKDEQKQAEGDPIVRARQRSLARDRSRRRMIAAVPRATMVIANPTHYAVALRYVREEAATPMVLAKGLDHIALNIRKAAERHGVPVIEDRELARSLYAAVDTDRPIPPEFYKAVAEIVLFLMSRNPSSASTVRRLA